LKASALSLASNATKSMKASEIAKTLQELNLYVGSTTNPKTGKARPYMIVDDEKSTTGRRFINRSAVKKEDENGNIVDEWQWTAGNEAQARQ